MEQSISFKIGKGSIAHNARDFTASNVDSNRSQYNIEYVNKDLKQTYHELFDDAVTKYNARQTRSDRTIPNYYEKIRQGIQCPYMGRNTVINHPMAVGGFLHLLHLCNTVQHCTSGGSSDHFPRNDSDSGLPELSDQKGGYPGQLYAMV